MGDFYYPEEVLGQPDLAGEDEEHMTTQLNGDVVCQLNLPNCDVHVCLALGAAPLLDPRVEPVDLVLPTAARRQHLLHNQDLRGGVQNCQTSL